MSDDVEALAEIFKEHRVEQLGFPGAVKCHACDDWTEGTIHQHHAELAKAFFAAEVREALRESGFDNADLARQLTHACERRQAAFDEGYDKAMSDAHVSLDRFGYLQRLGESNGNPYRAALPDDQRKPGEAFCSDCPDHEGCSQGVPCGVAKRAAR